MNDTTVIEGHAVAIQGDVEPPAKTQLATVVPRFVVPVDEMVQIQEAKRDFYKRVMIEGQHYGKIPGIAKDVLLKPGAELLFSGMGMNVELVDAEPPIREYGEDGIEGHVFYRRVARVYRHINGERVLLVQAEGSCSSRETKYRWRESKRLCPECGGAFIIKGKKEYGGGWLCFRKQGGCGAKFEDGDASIEAQVVGKIPNPDLADLDNTILKMADKRAFVAACLLATGCSDIFTQDVEGDSSGSDDSRDDKPLPAAPAGSRGTPPRAGVAANAREAVPREPGGPKNLRDMADGEDHDPIRKGEAIDKCWALKRERKLSDALWQELMRELFPQHVSARTNIVSEGDLSVQKLRTLYAEANRRTKEHSRRRAVATAPPATEDPSLPPEPKDADFPDSWS